MVANIQCIKTYNTVDKCKHIFVDICAEAKKKIHSS